MNTSIVVAQLADRFGRSRTLPHYHKDMGTALVLSAGGMFAAWEAGVWKALHRRFEPSLIVGASAGALNGWLIAGGATPDQLAGAWLDPSAGRILRRTRRAEAL